jgi:hypothetical protein
MKKCGSDKTTKYGGKQNHEYQNAGHASKVFDLPYSSVFDDRTSRVLLPALQGFCRPTSRFLTPYFSPGWRPANLLRAGLV